MYNLKKWIHLLGLSMLVLFALPACMKENIGPKSKLSDGSYVELKFNGKTHRLDGVGGVTFSDTTIMLIDTLIEIKMMTISVGQVADLTNPIMGLATFGITISHYNGPGDYLFHNWDPSLSASTAFGITYFNVPEGYSLGRDYSETHSSDYIRISKDNNSEMSGSFSYQAEDNSGDKALCTGKFKIVK
jgi:hypothetical protein